MTDKKPEMDLMVTRNGVPVADQAEGTRQFKDACRVAPNPEASQVAAFISHITPLCFVEDAGGGEYIIDGVINVGEALAAAIVGKEDATAAMPAEPVAKQYRAESTDGATGWRPVGDELYEWWRDHEKRHPGTVTFYYRDLYTTPPAPAVGLNDVEELVTTANEGFTLARQWSGSAFLAGEKLPTDAMNEDECKAALYSDLCKLGNNMLWLSDELKRRHAIASHASQSNPVVSQKEADLQDNERLRKALLHIINRSRDDNTGTSKIVDMRKIAEIALTSHTSQ